MSGKTAVAAPVDPLPGMLDPHTYGEGFRLYGETRPVKHVHGIPGAVPNGQHRLIAADLLLPGRRADAQAPQAAPVC